MLDRLQADTFYKVVAAGACEPILLKATSVSAKAEVYAKLTDKLPLGVKALIIESIASCLAADLEMPTPEPFVIEITPDFIDGIDNPAIAMRLRNSCPVAFGTRALPKGSSLIPNEMPLTEKSLQQAANIFVFDALIDNPDRGGLNNQKTNCITDGKEIFAFDHEKAFASAVGLPIIGKKHCWSENGLNMYDPKGSHLFINELRKLKSNLNFTNFVNNWKKITDSRLDEYFGALPEEWNSEFTCATKILSVIKQIRDQIDDCMLEVNRVLEVHHA